LAKIELVVIEIIGLTEVVKKRKETAAKHKPTEPGWANKFLSHAQEIEVG